MGTLHDVADLDATAQAALVRKGGVTPSELVEATIQGRYLVPRKG